MTLTPHEARAAGLDLWDASHQYGKTLVFDIDEDRSPRATLQLELSGSSPG